jgi:hypothetical protein
MPSRAPRWTRPVAIAAALFGLLTVISGGLVLFGSPAVRAAAGNAVPFVLIFNFLAGFAYLLGAYAIWISHRLAPAIALTIGLATLAVFAVFIGVAMSGTPYEPRTVGAMALRAAFWLIIGVALARRGRKA